MQLPKYTRCWAGVALLIPDSKYGMKAFTKSLTICVVGLSRRQTLGFNSGTGLADLSLLLVVEVVEVVVDSGVEV